MQNASQGGQGLNHGQLVPHVVVGNLPTQKMGWKQREHGWVGPWHFLGHLEMEHRKETRMTVAPTCSKSVTNPLTNKRLETSMLHFEIWAGMLWSSRCFPVPILISQSWIVLARCGCHKKLRREAELGVGKFVSKKVPEKGRFNRVLNFHFLGCGFWMNSLMTKFHCQKLEVLHFGFIPHKKNKQGKKNKT